MKILSFHKRLKKTGKYPNRSDRENILNRVILESINESEREKELILNSLFEQVNYLDPEYRLKWINAAGLKNLPFDTSIDKILGRKCYEVWHNRTSPCESCPAASTLNTGLPHSEEIEFSDGSTRLVSAHPVRDDNGILSGVIEVELDITMRKKAEQALEKGRQRSRALLDAIPDVLLVFNNSGRFIDYHPADDFDILTDPRSPEGSLLSEVISPKLAESILKHAEVLSQQGDKRSFIFRDSENENSAYYDCRLIKTDINENVCIIRDFREQKKREEDIIRRSFHDGLTGLYNRAYFEEELDRIENSRNILPVSVIVIDVNGLKLVNDAFGHDYGDILLKNVSGILASNCRKSDVISRTGGDEFAIILPNSPLSEAEKLSARILEACARSSSDEIFTRPSVSAGCGELTDNSQKLSDIIKVADEKMYHSKIANRRTHLESMVRDIVKSMYRHGFQTKEHIGRCTELSLSFAASLGLSSEIKDKLKKLSLIHDIGNIRIPDIVLGKKGPLSDMDYEIIKEHPIIGFRIAKAIPDYANAAELVLYHHERWDGTGYPSGLSGSDIPLPVRIFSIIDSYDLITHGSHYRKAHPSDDALKEIEASSGKQFDPEFVSGFLKFIKRRGL